MKTRKYDWLNTEKGQPLYSYQIFSDGKWMNPHRNGVPELFRTEAERDEARRKAKATLK